MTDSEHMAWLQGNCTRLKLQAGVASIWFDPWDDDWYVEPLAESFATLGEAIDAASLLLSTPSLPLSPQTPPHTEGE